MLTKLKPKTLKGVLPRGPLLDILSSAEISEVACGSGTRSDLELPPLKDPLLLSKGGAPSLRIVKLATQDATLRSLRTRNLEISPSSHPLCGHSLLLLGWQKKRPSLPVIPPKVFASPHFLQKMGRIVHSRAHRTNDSYHRGSNFERGIYCSLFSILHYSLYSTLWESNPHPPMIQ